MKTQLLGLLVFTVGASAQPAYDVRVSRLSADLISLTTVQPDAENPAQRRIMAQFAADINGMYPKGFVTRNLAYVFTSTLAGKDLSEDKLTALMNGMLAGFDTASACAGSCDLMKSAQYRTSIERTYSALTSLGISIPEKQGVMRLLYQAANRVANPIVRPIRRLEILSDSVERMAALHAGQRRSCQKLTEQL